jgi:FkbM family methyltransferase
VGSNAGIYALSIARLFPDVRVVAVEPTTSTFRLLQRNVRQNGLSNVTTIHAAVGAGYSESMLQLNATGRDGLNTLGVATHPDSKVVGYEMVAVVPLDELVRQYEIRNVSVMKVDVEGGELGVFRGGPALLTPDDAPLILFEGYSFCTQGFGYHPAELIWLLEEWGYATFTLDSATGRLRKRQIRNGQVDNMFVAVKPQHRLFHDVVAAASP